MNYQRCLASLITILATITFISSCSQEEEEKAKDKGQEAAVQTEASSKNQILPKGDRQFGLSINETKGITFDSAYNQAIELGGQFMTLPLNWDQVETKPKKYSNPLPAIANEFYPTNNLSLSLELNPIDTNNLRLPKDLKGQKFSSPVVQARFKKTLNWLFIKLKDTDLKCIVIGNEVNGYLNSTVMWDEYIAFFKAVKAYCNRAKPGVPVGAKIMAGSVITDGNSKAIELANLCDVVMLTYYPIKGDFTVKSPQSINNTFDTMTRLFADKPIYMLELGYPSSKENGSSDQMQAQFIESAFKAWDKHADTIKLINFVWMNDISEDQLAAFGKYYKLKDTKFLSFLGSIGLCSDIGTKKAGYDQLKKETAARGW